MSEEMKLIQALCEALGFEVKRHVEVTKGSYKRTVGSALMFGEILFPDWDHYEFIGNGEYVEVKREATYKLIKMEDK